MQKERLVRTIRSLERNRELKARAEQRVDRAEATILTEFELSGASSARLGVYEVEIAPDGVRITRLPQTDYEQLELPRARARDQVESDEV